jgi:hypothetical protein
MPNSGAKSLTCYTQQCLNMFVTYITIGFRLSLCNFLWAFTQYCYQICFSVPKTTHSFNYIKEKRIWPLIAHIQTYTSTSIYVYKITFSNLSREFVIRYINTTTDTTFNMFMYRKDVDSLTVRSCSTNFSSGGTLHNVAEYTYHESFNLTTFDYDVAVLRVCTDIYHIWQYTLQCTGGVQIWTIICS